MSTPWRGVTGILCFPFRLHAAGELPGLSGADPDGRFRYQIHPAFSVRLKGTPLTPYPAFETWPNFFWSEKVPSRGRAKPPKDVSIAFFGATTYDAMRVDVWGNDARSELYSFSQRFLGWLRHSTAQAWVGDYEFQTDTNVKYIFPIDANGGALESPTALLRFVTPEDAAVPLSPNAFRESFDKAMAGIHLPLHWSLFYDGQNYHARADYERVVISFALSLEVARDTEFVRFCNTRTKPGIGTVLSAPFNDTDLLKHLSSALEAHCGRNLEKEEPNVWNQVKLLYVARHHVAHGRPAVVPSATGFRRVSEETAKEWIPAVRAALDWIESL